MSTTASPLPAAPLSGLSVPATLGAVALATAVLAASSWVVAPMYPVPMTMQTFAVTLVGALFGWRLGALTVLAWLGQAAIGLPVLAGGSGGLGAFAGPTAGYLAAFPLAAALTGYLAEAGWTGRRLVLCFVSMLAGNALILLMGAAWLSGMIGIEAALTAGVAPFVLGALLKSALGAGALALVPARKG